MRILIDMDGVLADFERGVLETYRALHPGKPFVPLDQRTSFYVKSQYPPECQPFIEEIYTSRGFYSGLPPISGALEALPQLLGRGDEVFICTSPLLRNPSCVQDKYDWVERHLGRDWLERMIVTKDKTLVHGTILIDDRPDVHGVRAPSWEHVLYTQPYNAHVPFKRRLTWKDWADII